MPRVLLALVLMGGVMGCARTSLAPSRTVSLPPFTPISPVPVLWMEPFDELRPEFWREIEVHGQTRYAVVDLDGRRCLKAESQAGASILVNTVRFDPEAFEWLSWQWRVDELVHGETLTRKDGSDAAARVYVYFDTQGLPWQKRNLDYVWSATLPIGTILPSAFAPSSKIIVVESGSEHLGQWRTIERNLEEDYQRCFGKGPLPDVIAIGIMSDTDNTRARAVAYFDEFRVARRSFADHARGAHLAQGPPPDRVRKWR